MVGRRHDTQASAAADDAPASPQPAAQSAAPEEAQPEAPRYYGSHFVGDCQRTLESSFAAVSRPIFAPKYAFFSIFQALQHYQTFPAKFS